jgi:group I intron endonuclease
MGYVYLITNLVNEKYYVGKTEKSLQCRWDHHRWQVAGGRRSRLASAIRKYGIGNFSIEFLGETADISNLEKIWIIALNSTDKDIGYNMTFGGDGGVMAEPRRGWHHSQDTLKRMSEQRTGTLSDAQKQHLRALNELARGKPRSDNWKRSRSLATKGILNPSFGRSASKEWKQNKSFHMKEIIKTRYRDERGRLMSRQAAMNAVIIAKGN